jgi:hypothetical protein
MTTFRLPVRDLDGLRDLLEAANVLRKLTRGGREGFRRKLEKLLAEKGADKLLYVAACRMSFYFRHVHKLPVSMEVELLADGDLQTEGGGS